MNDNNQPSTFCKLTARCDRAAYWDSSAHEYTLDHGCCRLHCGNAAAPGVQAAVLRRRYPKIFKRETGPKTNRSA